MQLKRRSAIVGLLGLGVALAAPGAFARGRVRFRSRGLPAGAVYRGPVLTRDQLRQCVAQQEAINKEGDEVDLLQSRLNQSEADLNALEESIKRQEAMVDRYSQQSVDNFNMLIERHRRQVERHNANLGYANARVDKVNRAVERFNAECGDRAYYDSDMRAVLAGK